MMVAVHSLRWRENLFWLYNWCACEGTSIILDPHPSSPLPLMVCRVAKNSSEFSKIFRYPSVCDLFVNTVRFQEFY